MNIQFNMLDSNGFVVDCALDTTRVIAYFDCMGCGRTLFFSNSYNQIAKLCDRVECPKCKKIHYHTRDEDGADSVMSFNPPHVKLDLFDDNMFEGVTIPNLVYFGLCTLDDMELAKKTSNMLYTAYTKTQELPKGHIPARPDEDFDLLVGELIKRFCLTLNNKNA